MGDVLPELCAVASPLGPTTASQLDPPLSHLLQCPLVLPTWQILVCSKWEEGTKNKTRAAKYKQLCKMGPLCISLRWHTLFIKDPDDHKIMPTLDFNFGRD